MHSNVNPKIVHSEVTTKPLAIHCPFGTFKQILDLARPNSKSACTPENILIQKGEQKENHQLFKSLFSFICPITQQCTLVLSSHMWIAVSR